MNSTKPPISWQSVRIRPPAADGDAVLALLFDLGATAVHLDADAVVTHFPEPFDGVELARRLYALSPGADLAIAATPSVDWSERWRDRLGAHDLGALVIAPPWLADPRDAARTIVIEPAMAFGTGDHPTTRGVVRLMSDVVRAGDTVADLGAGSAVLAIAAARLGATRVAAIEIDHDAISNAAENIDRNGVAERVTLIEGDATVILPLIAPVRVIVANIISSAIVSLLPAMRAALATDGAAVIGGVLAAERAALQAVLSGGGWSVVTDDVEGEWWSATIRPS